MAGVIVRGPREKLAAWVVTGPLGHLYGTLADIALLWMAERAQKYGLEFEPIAGLSPDAEPTAADLLNEHVRRRTGDTCASCGKIWPCNMRRVAERALQRLSLLERAKGGRAG